MALKIRAWCMFVVERLDRLVEMNVENAISKENLNAVVCVALIDVFRRSS
jgi:hypothetical protein